jgi:hypothetical protein
MERRERDKEVEIGKMGLGIDHTDCVHKFLYRVRVLI